SVAWAVPLSNLEYPRAICCRAKARVVGGRALAAAACDLRISSPIFCCGVSLGFAAVAEGTLPLTLGFELCALTQQQPARIVSSHPSTNRNEHERSTLPPPR